MVDNCPFVKLCQFCDEYFLDICCLFKTYKDNDFKECKKIAICPNFYLCQDALNGKLSRMSLFNKLIPSLEDIKSQNYNVKEPFKIFPYRFIPRIEVSGENFKNQIKIIKKLGINLIIVSLADFISNVKEEILKVSYRQDLHDKLNFDGKILLQTNIPDCYCIKIMGNHLKYIEALNCLNPDVITTFDGNFYLDQPLFINSIQIINILNANLLINELNIPQIFLIPPVPLPLFKSIFEVFLRSNHESLCIPVAEFSKSKNPYILKILNHVNFMKETSEKKFELLLLSKNPDRRMFAECYSSNTWAKIKNRNLMENHLKNMEGKLLKSIRSANKIKFQKSLYSFFKRR